MSRATKRSPKRGKAPDKAPLLQRLVAEMPLLRGGDARIYAQQGFDLVPIDSLAFMQGLAARYFKLTGKDCGEAAIRKAVFRLGGESLRERITPVRFVEGEAGSIWIDVGPGDPAFVHVSASGVRLRSVSPTGFIRPIGMRRLPLPVIPKNDEEARQALEDFWMFLQFDRAACVASFAWMVAAMRPMQDLKTRGLRRYAILGAIASHGGRKTSVCDALRDVVDPRSPNHVELPNSPRDLAISGEAQRVLSFDNVSAISATMADALCRRATGDGLQQRSLFTNRDLTVMIGANPCILNTIEDVVFERADLLTRVLLLDVPPGSKRLTDEEVSAAFAGLRARVFGALCYCLAQAIREPVECHFPPGLRMSGPAAWAVAAGRAIGISEIEIVAAYMQSATRGEAIVLDKELPATLLRFIKPGGGWVGTSEQLLHALTAAFEAKGWSTPRDWPGNARALRGALARLEPSLAREGIRFDWSLRTNHARNFRITRDAAEASAKGDGR